MRNGNGELSYKQLRDENERLRKENGRLRDELNTRTVAFMQLMTKKGPDKNAEN